MWDLTVPGNNDHDFYIVPAEPAGSGDAHHDVAAAMVPVLVHNCGGTVIGLFAPMKIRRLGYSRRMLTQM